MLKTSRILTSSIPAWLQGTKVATPDGTPIVVYHGTDKKFRRFSLNKSTQGILWFTSDKSSIESGDVGAQGSGIIMNLYASIKNPAGWKEYDQLGLGELKGRGYDGAILPESDGTFTGFVFHPDQLRQVPKKLQ